jgi:hypothetical protein
MPRTSSASSTRPGPRLASRTTEHSRPGPAAGRHRLRPTVGADGSFPDLVGWASWVETGELPADLDALMASALDGNMPEGGETGAAQGSAAW